MTTPVLRARGLVVALCMAVASLTLLAGGAAQAQTVPLCPENGLCRLSVGLPDSDILEHQASPDGRWAVFFLEEQIGGDPQNDLYSVPVRGGAAPVKLDVAAAVVIGRVLVSPDSTRVVYEAQTEVSGPWAVFSVPIQGPVSAARRIANDITPHGAGNTAISPDSGKVVVLAATRDRLRVVPIDGPANAGARLTAPLGTGRQITSYKISGNSRSVVYRTNQTSSAPAELFRVPLTLTPEPAPPTTRLNGPLPPGGSVFGFVLAPNSSRVVFLATDQTSGRTELFSVGLGGSGRVKINAPLPPSHNVAPRLDVADPVSITPDSSRVVYETLLTQFGVVDRRLFSVPLAGPSSAAVRLDDEAATEPAANVVTHRLSGDGTRVVYSMSRSATSSQEEANWLLSVPIAGPASAGFSLDSAPRSEPHLYSVSPDGQRVVWELFLPDEAVLHSTPTAGPASARRVIDAPGQDPVGAKISPNSDRVVYFTTGQEADLFSTAIVGGSVPVNLTGSIHFDFVGGRFALPANGQGQRVVFAALREFGESGFQLYSSPLVPGA